MPWTAKTFRARHNHALTDAQAAKAAEVANAVLRRTGDEGKAIRAGNAAVKYAKKRRAGVKTDRM